MEKVNERYVQRAIPSLPFFCLFFLYVCLWIDPTLLFHGDGSLEFPVFASGSIFLKRHLAQPGGVLEYLASLLSQCYCCRWAGALVATALATLLGWATSACMREMAGVRVPGVWAIPGLFLLSLCGRYAHQLAELLALLAALLVSWTYLKLARRAGASRPGIFLGLLVPLYYLAGGTCILFALLCGISELRRRKGVLLALCGLLLAGAIPYVLGVLVMGARPMDAYWRLTPYHPVIRPEQVTLPGLYTLLGLELFLAAAGMAGAAWRAIPRIRHDTQSAGSADQAAPSPGGRGPAVEAPSPGDAEVAAAQSPSRRLRDLVPRSALGFAVLLLASAVVALLSYDAGGACVRRINKMAKQERWEQALREARNLAPDEFPYRTQHIVTRALYETRRLPDEMFSFPQHRAGYLLALGVASRKLATPVPLPVFSGSDALAGVDLSDSRYVRLRLYYFVALGDLNLQLGFVNGAEHEAYEALEGLGEHPLILKRLALANIAKGQTEAAKVILRAMRSYLYYGDYAEEALRRLEADPSWSGDPQMDRIRSVMLIKTDLPTSFMFGFDQLLRRNPRNRMAFEYLMAFHLLNLTLEDFVDQLHHLDQLGYQEVPRHYQEAIVLYENLSGEKVDLRGREVSPETRQRYQDFYRTFEMQPRLNGRPRALKAIRDSFGDTYFYYFVRHAESML